MEKNYLRRSLISLLLTKNCSGDQIEKNEMGWACSTNGGVHVYTGVWLRNLREETTWKTQA